MTDDPKTWPVRRAVSAGGVVVQAGADGHSVVLVRPSSTGDRVVWGLPKGTLEPGESPEVAAVREVREETGLDAEIVEHLDDITYWFTWAPDRTRVRKTVHFYLMRALGGDTEAHDDEIQEVRLVPVDQAPKQASYQSERKLLRRAAEVVRRW